MDERADLLTALARSFPTDAAAERLLAQVGLSHERRRNLDHVPCALVWAEALGRLRGRDEGSCATVLQRGA
jgi:hypothetical protein